MRLSRLAMEVPVVAASATGCVDAAIDGEIECLVNMGNAHTVSEYAVAILESRDHRAAMGAREHVLDHRLPNAIFSRIADIHYELFGAS